MDLNEEVKKLEDYQEAFKYFNGISADAAMLLAECRMNYTQFLDQHPQFKPCFAYAGANMYVGLYQHFLESAGYVATIDWKAPAGMCLYSLARCGLPEAEYRKLNLEALAPYDTQAILARVGLALSKSDVRLFQIAPEFDDVFVAGIAPAALLPAIIQSAYKIGVRVVCIDEAYVKEKKIDLKRQCDREDRLGLDAIYQKVENNEKHYLFSDVRYSETGRIQLEQTPFGERLSPQWLAATLENQPELLEAYHKGRAEIVLSVIYDPKEEPLIFNDPYSRFHQ